MEVTARIQFTRPCLGNVRKDDYDRLLRAPDGEVIFLVTWWRAALAKAARAINRYHAFIDKISPALPVDGPVSHIKRWYGKGTSDFKIHEGFDAGAVVMVRFLLPSGMTLDQFTELLETVGEYFGVSPYGWRESYGLFKVLEVVRSARKRTATTQPGTDQASG
jgi:hypothetical protein